MSLPLNFILTLMSKRLRYFFEKTRFKTNPKPLDKCFFGLEQVQKSWYKFKKVNWFFASFNMLQMLIIFTSFKHVWTCVKDGAIRHNYCITFCKQVWTCIYYMMQSNQIRLAWAGLGIIASLFSNNFWTSSKDIAIKTNYCITFINTFKTSFYLFKRWCN